MSNKGTVKGNFKYLCALLLSVAVTACAATPPKFKNDSDKLFFNLSGSEVEELFPAEFRDVILTRHQGDEHLANDNIDIANMYYQLAIGKMEFLEKSYLAEIKRREDAARLELEKREKEAAEELRRVEAIDRERAEEAVKAAAMAKKIAEDKAEARKKAERRPEVIPAMAHTVKRGETLPQIAARPEVYGDSSLWPLLYKANRDQISNPAVLWPGQVLRIPRNLDRSDLSEARRFSSDRQLR